MICPCSQTPSSLGFRYTHGRPRETAAPAPRSLLGASSRIKRFLTLGNIFSTKIRAWLSKNGVSFRFNGAPQKARGALYPGEQTPSLILAIPWFSPHFLLSEPSLLPWDRIRKRRRSQPIDCRETEIPADCYRQELFLSLLAMASEDVKTSESAVSTIVNLAEEAKLAREGVKGPSYALLSICKSLIAGGVAGGVSRTAVAPLERLKILLQVQNPHSIKYNGTVQGLKYIWRTEGFRGLFKGNGTNCARIVPNSAVKFFSYEQASKGILHLYRQQTGNEDAQLTPVLRLGAGACAGIIAMSATYPMDMVRGRLTVQTEKSPYQYRGIFHALSTVLREEGPRALYRGWLPSVIGVVPYVGLNFAVYESLKDWLTNSRPFGLVDGNELSVTTRLACGAVAGTVGQTVAYPLDVIRRRMQMVGWNNAASVITGDGRGKAPLEYNGMVDAFRKTVRHEGFGALYKGLVPNSVKVVPSIAIAFVTYEMVKDLLGVEIRISD